VKIKRIVKLFINIVVFVPGIIVLPIFTIGYWIQEEDLTFLQSLKRSWGICIGIKSNKEEGEDTRC